MKATAARSNPLPSRKHPPRPNSRRHRSPPNRWPNSRPPSKPQWLPQNRRRHRPVTTRPPHKQRNEEEARDPKAGASNNQLHLTGNSFDPLPTCCNAQVGRVGPLPDSAVGDLVDAGRTGYVRWPRDEAYLPPAPPFCGTLVSDALDNRAIEKPCRYRVVL